MINKKNNILLLFKQIVKSIDKNVKHYPIKVQKIHEFEFMTNNILEYDNLSMLDYYELTYKEILNKIENKEFPPFPYIEEMKDDYYDFHLRSIEKYFRDKKYYDSSMIDLNKK